MWSIYTKIQVIVYTNAYLNVLYRKESTFLYYYPNRVNMHYVDHALHTHMGTSRPSLLKHNIVESTDSYDMYIICERLWENPAYGIRVQFVQCAFLVPQVENHESPDFVISMSKNPSSNCCRRLRRLLWVTKAKQTFISIYLVCTAAIHRARC